MSTQVIVNEQALREMIKEALNNGHLGDLSMPSEPEEELPVNVNNIVDQSETLTDPCNPDYVPQTKPELDVAVKQLTDDVTIDKVPSIYKAIRSVITADEEKTEEEEMKKSDVTSDSKSVEEAIRKEVRKMLREAGSYRDPADVAADEEEAELAPRQHRTKAYKTSAIGNMADVGGASFEEIAKDLDFSVAGAKQAVDKALEKARWVATGIDPDELEVIVLTTMNDYIKMLAKTGELSAADVQLMKSHPEIVRTLDGFREFLHNALRRARKTTDKLIDPLGESSSKKHGMRESLKRLLREDHGELTTKCKFCGKDVKTYKTSAGEYFDKHMGPDGESCMGSQSRVEGKPMSKPMGEAKDTKGNEVCGKVMSKTDKRKGRHVCALKPGHKGSCAVNNKN